MERITVRNGEVGISVIVDGPADAPGPPILCVHGWPELAHSWRHQIAHFAGRGRRIAAMDVRGYGASSKPEPVSSTSTASIPGSTV